jgi:transcriptional regulator with XRE-family HTH domain
MAFFGENLRRQRELRGIELREIAEATKISIRFLQALETDRVDVLPGGIFRRSFVRAYARYVGLDPERMVAEFLHAHGEEPVGAAKTSEKKPEPAAAAAATSRNGFYRRLFLAAVLLGVCGAATSFARRGPGAPEVSVPAPAVIFPPASLLPQPLREPATTFAGPLVLTLKAREDCWVALQTDGRKSFSGIIPAGQSQTIEAQEELILDVGNAGVLEALINDRPALPLGERGEVRKNIVINRASLPSLVEAQPPRRTAQSG